MTKPTKAESDLVVRAGNAEAKLRSMADAPNHMHHLSGDDAAAILFLLSCYRLALHEKKSKPRAQ